MNAPAITVHVRFFGVLRETVGAPALTRQVEPGTTAQALYAHLQAQFPALAAYAAVVRPAVNARYAGAGVELCDGDEVVYITPVSGG